MLSGDTAGSGGCWILGVEDAMCWMWNMLGVEDAVCGGCSSLVT